mmetsp:Transcript_26734/g.50910  ORF Transcript_26734/g.50910 Transcript_26734/m.50910 type:complete len:213 (+) Transcript_26734:903-1541(+)
MLLLGCCRARRRRPRYQVTRESLLHLLAERPRELVAKRLLQQGGRAGVRGGGGASLRDAERVLEGALHALHLAVHLRHLRLQTPRPRVHWRPRRWGRRRMRRGGQLPLGWLSLSRARAVRRGGGCRGGRLTIHRCLCWVVGDSRRSNSRCWCLVRHRIRSRKSRICPKCEKPVCQSIDIHHHFRLGVRLLRFLEYAQRVLKNRNFVCVHVRQ